MAVASSNPFPYVTLVPAAAPGSPSAGQQRLYMDSGDSNKLKRKDSSGTVVSVESSGASGAETVVSKTTTYTAAASEFVKCDTSGGAFTVTSPAHASGASFTVHKTTTDVNAVTISPASGTIDGATSYKLYGRGASVTLISDGTNWFVSREVASVWVAYTPTMTGTSFTIGNGTVAGKWRQVGKRIDFVFRQDSGSTTNHGSSVYTLGLPITSGAGTPVGMFAGYSYDASAGFVHVLACPVGGGASTFQAYSNGASAISNSSPITRAVSDTIEISGWYEV